MNTEDEEENLVERFKKLKTHKEGEEDNEEEDFYELSTEEIPETFGPELMEYELEERSEEKIRESHYWTALEKLYTGDFNAFLDDEVIKKEFPRIEDDVKVNCGNDTRLINFYSSYIALWEGDLYWERLKNKFRLYTYVEDFDENGHMIKIKYIDNTISVECFEAFMTLVDLVNVTKFMAYKLNELRKRFTFDFYKEIMEPIVNALSKVYDKFLEH